LANFYQYVGRHADAEPLLREQLEVSREISASTETIAACIASIGVNLLDQGRTAEAEEPLRTALALLEGDEEFSGVARQTRDKLAELLQASDRHSECETLWRETLERARRRFGAGHSLAGLTLRRMGELLLTQEDRLPEALAAAEESWRILGMRLGSFHDEAHRVLCLLADACDRQGEYAEAADALEHVLETYRERAPLVGYQRSQQTDLVNRIVSIYEGWDAAEPGQGHAAEAEEWRAELRGWADVSGPRP
jgi:tetratricopeptide (TPR) repeat protein